MVHTLTVLTLQLAQAIGLYMLAIGIGLLTDPVRVGAIVADMERSPGLTTAFGVAAFAIGTAILIPHHILYDPLSIIVTLIAAIAAVEGLILLAAPQLMIAIARPFVASARLLGIVAFVFGLMIFFCGFLGRADALP